MIAVPCGVTPVSSPAKAGDPRLALLMRVQKDVGGRAKPGHDTHTGHHTNDKLTDPLIRRVSNV
jgi:hypothetical protein